MQNTKRVLAQALREMLKTTSLEKITVRQVVERCNLNRQTFYYHFHDIYELLEYMMFVELDKVFENPMESEVTIFTEKWEKVYYTILYSLFGQKRMVMNVFHSIGRFHLEYILYDVLYYIILRFIKDESEGLEISHEERVFIADFYKYAFVGITIDWVNSCMKVEPEVIVRRVSKLIGGNIREGLHKNYKNN